MSWMCIVYSIALHKQTKKCFTLLFDASKQSKYEYLTRQWNIANLLFLIALCVNKQCFDSAEIAQRLVFIKSNKKAIYKVSTRY